MAAETGMAAAGVAGSRAPTTARATAATRLPAPAGRPATAGTLKADPMMERPATAATLPAVPADRLATAEAPPAGPMMARPAIAATPPTAPAGRLVTAGMPRGDPTRRPAVAEAVLATRETELLPEATLARHPEPFPTHPAGRSPLRMFHPPPLWRCSRSRRRPLRPDGSALFSRRTVKVAAPASAGMRCR